MLLSVADLLDLFRLYEMHLNYMDVSLLRFCYQYADDISICRLFKAGIFQ